ncbi:sulfite exporter TauE/SafE family protein [Sediminibacterium soli]|uniref:sulfite exporter TauE/SafE family protein n=1 Tax=Sediminibacterium soli TaxID=2698829 RepID=UPI001F2680AD|nr:sulfite exporter TauE/SafE family protein [Sediminibacterium soli]
MAGYLAALLIGIFLGLIGGGGSILTIPVLVYFFGLPPYLATGYSLFIVGCSSLAGAWKHYRFGNIHTRAALSFGITSIITVVLVRKWLLPVIPEELFCAGGFTVTKSLATMVLFAMVMIVASLQMIRKETVPEPSAAAEQEINLPAALLRGVEVGILTGLLGAGGGFLILPVLVFSFHLPMKKAIGTSLLIIAMNTLSGFIGDLFHQSFNWWLLLPVTATAIAGTFLGRKMGERISGDQLKKGFGWFVLVTGIYILIHELFLA